MYACYRHKTIFITVEQHPWNDNWQIHSLVNIIIFNLSQWMPVLWNSPSLIKWSALHIRVEICSMFSLPGLSSSSVKTCIIYEDASSKDKYTYSPTFILPPTVCTIFIQGRLAMGWSSSLGRVKNFQFSILSRPALGFTQPPIQRALWALPTGVKKQGHEAVHSLTTMLRSRKHGYKQPLPHKHSW